MLISGLKGLKNHKNLEEGFYPGGWGYSINYWVGMCRWGSETLSLY